MKTYEYTECYIAFLDMLGFKKLVNDNSCNDIIEIFDTFNHKPIRDEYLGDDSVITKSTVDNLKMKVMSDSICLWIDAKVPDALMCIIMACIMLQFKLLYRSTPIFLRGAIVQGKIYANKDIIFGPGLTGAYLMEENNAKYPRIILTREVLSNIDCSDSIKEHKIRSLIFKDFDAFYATNCFYVIASVDKKVYEKIASQVDYILDTIMDSSIREKYLYVDKKLKEKVEPIIRKTKNK